MNITTLNPVELAKTYLENLIDREEAFDIPRARLLAVIEDDIVLIRDHSDVYDLLEDADIPDEAEALLIHTSGWAAPLNADGEADGLPSHHPERRRVSLISVISDEGVGSALAFADGQTDIVTDEGNASGALADALAQAWRQKWS